MYHRKHQRQQFIGQRIENVYIFKIDDVASLDGTCRAAINDSSWLWYKRLGHAHMNLISKLFKRN